MCDETGARVELPYSESTTETVEMTEVDGTEKGAVLHFMGKTGHKEPFHEMEVHTCLGDIYVMVNALRDYARILDKVILAWDLTGYHGALYSLHAKRCRKIADKVSEQTGYDYDAALERCRKRRAKGEHIEDSGLDGLEALIREQRKGQKVKP